MVSLKQKSNGIQVLRAVLFIGILAFHAGVPGSQVLWGGVESFFVLSAYFLTKKLSKTPEQEFKIIPQIRHRLSRLYPVYLLLIIGTLGVVVLIKNSWAITDFLCHLLFSQNINWMIKGYNSDMAVLTAHTWTLSIEVYLFVIWLIAFRCLRNRKQWVSFNFLVAILAIVWRVVTVIWIADPMITSLCPIAHMDAFALGSLIALRENDGAFPKRKVVQYSCLLAGLAVIAFCISYTALSNSCSLLDAYRLYKTSSGYLNNPYTCNVYLGFSLITAGLVLATKSISVGRLFTPLVMIGNVSYSAYLIHYPVNVLLLRVTDNRWIVFGITFVLSVVAAWIIEQSLSKVCVEKAKLTRGD